MWTFRFFWFFQVITIFWYIAVPFNAVKLWWKKPYFNFSYCWGTSYSYILESRQYYLNRKMRKARSKIWPENKY